MQGTAKPFISYSNNRADVLLHRLFGRRDDGFFVDVGAGHPVIGNDTKALSDRGWTGINIEPREALYRELAAQRPRDRNLNVAVSDDPGTIAPPSTAGPGLSGCRIETRRLRDILEEASPPRIDLLTIGSPGSELRVLASNDWRRFRPRLIVVEAAAPDAPAGQAGQTTPFLRDHGYRHVHFDGLHDYYAEAAFDVPEAAFGRPVNALDNFVPYGDVRESQARDTAQSERERRAYMMAQRTQALEIDLRRANQEIVALRREISDLVGAGHSSVSSRRADELAREIEALHASTSWRITRPLRALARPRRTLNILLGRGAG